MERDLSEICNDINNATSQEELDLFKEEAIGMGHFDLLNYVYFIKNLKRLESLRDSIALEKRGALEEAIGDYQKNGLEIDFNTRKKIGTLFDFIEFTAIYPNKKEALETFLNSYGHRGFIGYKDQKNKNHSNKDQSEKDSLSLRSSAYIAYFSMSNDNTDESLVALRKKSIDTRDFETFCKSYVALSLLQLENAGVDKPFLIDIKNNLIKNILDSKEKTLLNLDFLDSKLAFEGLNDRYKTSPDDLKKLSEEEKAELARKYVDYQQNLGNSKYIYQNIMEKAILPALKGDYQYMLKRYISIGELAIDDCNKMEGKIYQKLYGNSDFSKSYSIRLPSGIIVSYEYSSLDPNIKRIVNIGLLKQKGIIP